MFKRIIASLKALLNAGHSDQVAPVLRQIAQPALDYTSAQSLSRIHSQLDCNAIRSLPATRLAVLGSFTTKQLVPLIDLYLFAAGVRATFYEGEYGVLRQEVFDSESRLHEFQPQTVFLGVGTRDLGHLPNPADDREGVSRCVKAEQADWSALWDALQRRHGCQVIQNNFPMPPWRAFANYEMRQPGSLSRFISQTNHFLVESAPPFVTIHDVDHLAASSGRWSWDDPRFVHQAKMPCAPEYLVDYAHSVASLIAAQLGLAKKRLVLDLDNTLWGGVIGDDGLGGIRLGQGDAEGEAFQAFQQYVKALRMRGVILAVCSKNDDATAREVFEKHTEMVLRPGDISCFVANWDDKATNIRRIADQLNIGLGSLVFVDDNPAERAIVRRLVPEVVVPELPDDVTAFVQAIEQQRCFQVTSVGTEDFQRTEYYQADALRQRAASSAGDLDGFLQSLQMAARVRPIDSTNLERSVQLIHRSNQFNLTTRRRTAAEILAILEDESWVTVTVSLADRFGDNGLISVLLARDGDDALEIDTWLMSCRVLKRGVERFLLNYLCGVAISRGYRTIRGEYLPTPKNSLVRRHYVELGFTRIAGEDDDGPTRWELTLSEDWAPHPTNILEIS